MSQWAGEGVGGVKKVQPAADIVTELVTEAEKCLENVSRTRAAQSGPAGRS